MLLAFLLFVACPVLLFCAKTYQLNEVDPSYAIHGRSLRKEKDLVLYGCPNCTFLVDFSKYACNIEPQQLDENLTSATLIKQPMCSDPLPFSINQQILDPDSCTELWPYDLKFQKYLYTCSSKISADSLSLTLIDDVKDFEFAVSFRVVEWTKDDQRVLVVPMRADVDEKFHVLLGNGVLTVLVAHPRIVEQNTDPTMQLQAYNADSAADTEACRLYMPDVSCGKHVNYFLDIGSMRGKIKSNSTFMFSAEAPITSRATVTTVYTNESCSFCLCFSSRIADYVNALDLQGPFTSAPLLANSLDYPWIRGESEKHVQSMNLSFRYYERAFSWKQTEVNIVSIDAGTLFITTYGSHVDQSCNFTNPIMTERFNQDSQNRRVWFERYSICFMVQWYPNIGNVTTTPGFMFTIRPVFIQDPDDVECRNDVFNFLHAGNPSLIFHAWQIFDSDGDLVPICIACFENACTFIIDVVRNCEKTKEDDALKCPSRIPFAINDQILSDADCEYRNFTNSIEQTCHYRIITNFFLLMVYPELLVDLQNSAISFRLAGVTNLSYSFHLYTFSANHSDPIAVKMKPSSTWTWISFSLLDGYSLKTLGKLRWDRYEQNCTYQLYMGGPTPANSSKTAKLLDIYDYEEHPFIPQFLESAVYSVLVPPGCAPSIIISCSSTLYPNWPQQTQQICEGWSFAVTQNYHTNTADTILLEGYHLWRQIQCSRWPIDIFIEFVGLADGLLTVTFQDPRNQTIDDLSLTLESEEFEPFNLTIHQVSGVIIYWQKMNDYDGIGCLVRVHVHRAAPIMDITSAVSEEITIPNHHRRTEVFKNYLFLLIISLTTFQYD